VAVATGRSTEADLRAAGADVVLPDLTDTAAVIRAIQRCGPPPASPPPASRLPAGRSPG